MQTVDAHQSKTAYKFVNVLHRVPEYIFLLKTGLKIMYPDIILFSFYEKYGRSSNDQLQTLLAVSKTDQRVIIHLYRAFSGLYQHKDKCQHNIWNNQAHQANLQAIPKYVEIWSNTS